MTMTDVKSFFLTCLKDHLQGKKTTLPVSHIPLQELFRIAEEQSVGGIIYYQLSDQLELRVGKEGFEKHLINDVYLSVNREYLFKEAAEHFFKHGIEFSCMKGAVIKDCYPVPELRTMGDIDIIIHPEDREQTDRIMKNELSYKSFVDNQSVWTYDLGLYEFEIHDHMFYEYLANRFDYRTYFDSVWEHSSKKEVFGIMDDRLLVPDMAFHLLYTITHMAKHVINNGTGFRSYMDICLMSQKIDNDDDWLYISQELDKMGLLDFTGICSSLIKRWFDISIPIKTPDLDESFFNEITEKTFRDGTFGLSNKANDPAKAAKEIRRSNSGYFLGAVRVVIKRLFPSYEDMQLIPWYSFVNGRPWLMPLAWFYRWGYSIINKFKQGAGLLLEPLLKKKDIKEREVYLKKWGL